MAHVLTKLSIVELMERGGYATVNELGRVIGVRRHNLQRMKHDGVPITRADEFAVKCGFHPTEVWGDDYYRGLTDPGVSLLDDD